MAGAGAGAVPEAAGAGLEAVEELELELEVEPPAAWLELPLGLDPPLRVEAPSSVLLATVW